MLDHAAKLQLSISDQGLPALAEAPLASTSGPIRFRLRAGPDGSACEALDDTGGVVASAMLPLGTNCELFRITSSGPGRLEYLWVAGE